MNHFDTIYPDLDAMKKEIEDMWKLDKPWSCEASEWKHEKESLLKHEALLLEESPVRRVLKPNPYVGRPQIHLMYYITQYTTRNPSIFFGNLQQF